MPKCACLTEVLGKRGGKEVAILVSGDRGKDERDLLPLNALTFPAPARGWRDRQAEGKEEDTPPVVHTSWPQHRGNTDGSCGHLFPHVVIPGNLSIT